jgi:hypothetical protein
MARDESDREDLMREAVALKRRMEIETNATATPPGDGDVATGASKTEPIVLGFRDATGWFSIYFGQDPVYTWDDEGRLRRAYEQGCLFRTQGTTLARLERRRGSSFVELVRHDLDAAECAGFVARMHVLLRGLHDSLAGNRYVLKGCVTAPLRQPAVLRKPGVSVIAESTSNAQPGAMEHSTQEADADRDGSSQLVSDALAAIVRVLEQPKPFAPPIPGKR